MNIHTTHRVEAAASFKAIIILAGILLLIWLMPVAPGIAGYLVLHNLMEVAAICVAVMVFAIGWNTSQHHQSGNVLILACIFLSVALLDFSHAMSFQGMPDYITPSSPEKGINFWLAARSLAAFGLLIAAFRSWQKPCVIDRYIMLGAVLLLTALLHVVLLLYPHILPDTFKPGSGLTPFKVHYEYALIALYLLAAVLFLRQLTRPRSFNASCLFAAAVILAMSEFFFTLYAEVADLYNLVGHFYKIAAYIFLYRALFVETVQYPFLQLESAKEQLQATIDTLPDLLFRMNLSGEYLEVHTSAEHLLCNPVNELLGRKVSEIMSAENSEIVMNALQEASAKGMTRGQRIELQLQDGSIHWYELSVARMRKVTSEAPDLLVLSRDITETIRSEEALKREADLNAALLSLQNVAETRDEKAFMQYGAETAERITASRISFIHFINADQETIELAAWSQRTLDASHLALTETHYPISKAGIWADALRKRAPQIVNDYAHEPGRRGLPEGHSQLIRMLSLPVIEDGLTRMIVGVGNKDSDYNSKDVELLQIIADAIWRIANKRRTNDLLRKLTMAVEQSPNSIVITDLDAQIEYVNPAFTAVSGYTLQEVTGKNPRILQSGKTAKEVYVDMWATLTQGNPWRGEFINRSKQGDEFIERTMIYPVRNNEGVITNYLSHKENITAQRLIEQRINQLMQFDALTGLPNRDSLLHMLKRAVDLARLQSETLAVMWINIDHFKQINDSINHEIGDLVLQELTIRLKQSMREDDYLARISGDHYVLVGSGLDQNAAIPLVLKMLASLDEPIKVKGHELNITLSIGIALYPTDGESISDLLKNSESAMYRMKREGRNCYRFYTPDLQEQSTRILALGSALKNAVSRNELRLVYQPQFDLHRNQVIGVEALLRWSHPEYGDISPTEFIPIAESYGLIVEIGNWVIRTALLQLKQWQALKLPEMTMAINLSSTQFQQPQLADVIMHLVEEVGVEPRLLVLELTEAVAMRNSEYAAEVLKKLNVKGFMLSIDDFGTGYSSLSYLKRFEVDKLKIDQSFVHDLTNDESDQAIVDAIIQMASSLGFMTIAEGVETQEQLDFLKEKGCDQIQGYFFSRPLSPEMLEAFVTNQNSNPAS